MTFTKLVFIFLFFGLMACSSQNSSVPVPEPKEKKDNEQSPAPQEVRATPVPVTTPIQTQKRINYENISEGDYGPAFSCRHRKEYLDELFSHPIPIQELFKKVVRHDTKVIFFSEQHSNVAAVDEYPQLFSNLKKNFPKIDCIFLEMPQEYQKIFDDYLQGRSSMDASVGSLFDREWQGSVPLHPGRKKLFEVAKSLRIKIIPVDMNDKDRGDIKLDLTSTKYLQLIVDREKVMSNRIKYAFKGSVLNQFNPWGLEPECKMAVMPVGGFHLSGYIPQFDSQTKKFKSLYRFPGKRLPEQIQKAGLKSISIQVVGTSSGGNNSREWDRDDCGGDAYFEPPIEVAGFVKPIRKFPPIPTEKSVFTLVWNDFDATIVIPNWPWGSF